MKLRDEHLRSYVDDIKQIGLLRFLTWRGVDVAAAWEGAYEPATRSDDAELATLVKFNRDHYLYYRALVERHMECTGTVLDVGCGSGARTAMLARYATHVIGIDNDMLKVSAAAQLNNAGNAKIEWYGGDFMAWTFANTFDYVFAVEVIEHMSLYLHPAFIDKMLNILAPGGRILMTTPRDRPPERKHPHIGLWADEDAERIVSPFEGAIEYFNHRQLQNGGETPWSTKEDATHYVVVINK